MAGFLRARLAEGPAEWGRTLHQRASAWYAQHNLPAEAVQHALAIPDPELAARFIEPIALDVMYNQGQVDTVLGWMTEQAAA